MVLKRHDALEFARWFGFMELRAFELTVRELVETAVNVNSLSINELLFRHMNISMLAEIYPDIQKKVRSEEIRREYYLMQEE